MSTNDEIVSVLERIEGRLELLAQAGNKLDRALGLLATQGLPQDERIRVLHSLDYDWASIGELVGLKADTARKRLKRTAK